jgi:hypothetical protein
MIIEEHCSNRITHELGGQLIDERRFQPMTVPLGTCELLPSDAHPGHGIIVMLLSETLFIIAAPMDELLGLYLDWKPRI